MGVSTEFLGRQVRCPHCQQVVVAPPPAPNPEATVISETPPPPQEPAGLPETILHTPGPSADPEDIFAPTEASEDLFGRVETPRIEIPPDPLAPTVTEEGGFRPADAEPTLASTMPLFPPAVAAPEPANTDGTAILPSSGGEAPWLSGTATELLTQPPPETPVGPPPELPIEAPSAPRPARRKEPGTPWFMILVFSPLLLYSIVITVFAVLLYIQERDVEHQLRKRFEIMPDEGDNPGVEKGKKISRQIYRYDPKVATLPLPEHLCTTLSKSGGQPLRIGDVQITPVKVERKRVKVYVAGFEKAEPCLGDSLVLYFRVKNLSTEYAFAPLDNFFDRNWSPSTDQLPPFTQLEVDDKYRFYGGPAKWFPQGTTKEPRQWVEGRKGFEPELLQPGEEKEFFVCTDGSDPKAVRALFGVNKGEKVREPYHGPFLWRIRLRRGLVTIKDREYSATAVVGVRFTDEDIQTEGG
jgi:hypothetical protein